MPIYRGPGGSGDATADSSSEATLVAQLVVQAETAEANAASSATSAASSASAASSSASAAASSASTASTAATNAQTAETNAETAEANAETAEANAETAQAAAEAAQLAAETAQTAAETAETNAAASASSASTSATNASNSASSASTSATNASNSASAASTSATNAASSATSASGSATAAASSASSASTSASNAATSETNAATSASTATTQAGIATTQASNAATSASNAASSASSASTSASNASTSASNAATSASTASSAADAALAALDSFDDRYLGQKSSDPTLDNDGNALVAGALYFNTTDNIMKVYDGSSWLAAYASLSGALLSANNLSDLNNAATARTNLGVAIGTDVQAWDADLDTWATKTAPSGTVVGTSDSQTLTNKTLALGSNTVSGTLAQFNTAVTDADFASLAGTETLSNKTLAGVTNSGNLTFTGTGNRITGDFSNSTVANRALFQSSTGTFTDIGALAPSSSTQSSAWTAYLGNDPTNTSRTRMLATSIDARFESGITGTGTYLPLTMYTGGSERLRIDTSGNVGIGTSTPAGGGGGTTLNIFGTSAASLRVNSSTVTLDAFISGSTAFIQTGSNHPLNFRINGTTRMVMDTSGNVGVGTGASTITDKFTVSGAGEAGGISDSGSKESAIRVSSTGGSANDGGQIEFGAGYGSYAQSYFAGIKGLLNNGSGNSTGNLAFYTRTTTSDTSLTERMRIDSSGNVGIGTSSPSARFEVRSNTDANSNIAVFSNDSTGASSNTTFVIGAGGRRAFLQANYTGQYFWNSGISLTSYFQDYDTQIFRNNAGTERMRIDSSGNVQIGASSSYNGSRFRVYINNSNVGNGSSMNLTQDGTGDAAIGFLIGATTEWLAGVDNSDGDKFKINNITGSGDFNGTGLTIDTGGNVGIGTSSPGFPLDVVSRTGDAFGIRVRGRSSDNISVLRFTSNDAATNYGQFDVRSNTFMVRAVANIPMEFWTNDTERMRINSSGTLCIGTTSALSSAFKTNIENGRLGVSASNDQYALYLRYNTSTLGFYLGSPSANALAFSDSAGTERMRISSSGALGFNGANYGSSGQVLTSQGSGATPVWTTPSTSSGTVTSVATGNGLQGGTITTSGTLSIACPTFNTVGSYAMGTSDTGAGDVNPGSNISGGSVLCRSSGGNPFSTLSGTWRVMGGFIVPGYYYPVLLCRVS